jgi:tetratricopeptide (TPR) repeat protein
MKYGKNIAVILIAIFAFAVSINVYASDALVKGDAAFAKGEYKKAVDLYIAAAQEAPDSYEANWKVTMASDYYGVSIKVAHAPGWQKQCTQIGKTGMIYAEKAQKINPQGVEGYHWEAMSIGLYADGVSVVTAIKEGILGKTTRCIENAYKYGKSYDDWGPTFGMAMFYSQLPWPMKKMDKALKYFKEYEANSAHINDAKNRVAYSAQFISQLKGKEYVEFKDRVEKLLVELESYEEPYYRDIAKDIRKKLK